MTRNTIEDLSDRVEALESTLAWYFYRMDRILEALSTLGDTARMSDTWSSQVEDVKRNHMANIKARRQREVQP